MLQPVTVLTMAKGRQHHLANLLRGLAANTVLPARCVIVDLNDAPASLPPLPFPILHHHAPMAGLPLAAARNQAAALAETEALVFLDVDCISAPNLIETMGNALTAHDALICCEILYLPSAAMAGPMEPETLAAVGHPHPHRPFPAGLAEEPNTGLFWSLAFGIRRSRFTALGGFDMAFTGYGAEDTDLAFRAAAQGVPLLLTGETRAFHQYHRVYDPPMQHFTDILINAARFKARHGFWPMDGWLRAFGERGLIAWPPEGALGVLRAPSAAEVAAAACPPERAF